MAFNDFAINIVKEIRGSEILYFISVAELPDEQQPGTLIMTNPIENRLRESYKNAALRRDALIFNYNFFTGFPDIISKFFSVQV